MSWFTRGKDEEIQDGPRRRTSNLSSTRSKETLPSHDDLPPRASTSLSFRYTRSRLQSLPERSHTFANPSGTNRTTQDDLSAKSATAATLPAQTHTSRVRSRAESANAQPLLLSRDAFLSSEDYRIYLKKSSISLPYNFEHITHTAAQELPPLDTVTERDLPARFWSLSAYRRPTRHLTGIQADDLSHKLPVMGITRGAQSSRPASPTLCELDIDRPVAVESLCDSESLGSPLGKLDVGKALPMLPSSLMSDGVDAPLERKSSIATLNDTRLHLLSQMPSLDQLSPPTKKSQNLGTYKPKGAPRQAPPKPLDLVSHPQARDANASDSPRVSSDVESPTEIMSPTTSPRLSQTDSHRPPHYTGPASISVSSIATTASTMSAQSRPSTRAMVTLESPMASPVMASPPRSSNSRAARTLSADSWEADVEFSYQMEAESTCDFQWNGSTRHDSRSTLTPGERASSRPASRKVFPRPPSTRPGSAQSTIRSAVSRKTSRETLLSKQSPVGHRGFSAARTSSRSSLRPPASLGLGANGGMNAASVLSPIFSVAGADSPALPSPVSPVSPAYEPKQAPIQEVQEYSREYLSDPESINRSSSSCSSGDTTSYRSVPSVRRDPARWSFASANSVPELMQSKHRSKSGLQQSTTARQLDTVPASPAKGNGEGDLAGRPSPPPQQQLPPLPVYDPTRSSSQLSDHNAVRQAAGRAMQRLSASKPFSHFNAVHEIRPGKADERWI
ncbi:hypothetical protein LTR78_006575 [Recurvomyces mirabilis]|uniref:CRIB domain-containing protein n=1 Tax=Recurvomyces mirabilis TaxID=574656 RepID=A0AAE1BZX3_9PEZI|nr:hypothetical protein LTR78_006575 [Recurvomyces mirabilis]KAK5151008.1 hypothetical protein LTS14_009503 [Recurvomyces mirabilis]